MSMPHFPTSSQAPPAQQAKNMYRVGDFVYLEKNTEGPYAIRRIDELYKNSSGNVEAKLACFVRRRDIEKMLLKMADRADRKFEEYYEVDDKPTPDEASAVPDPEHPVANGDTTKEEPNAEKESTTTNGEASDVKSEEPVVDFRNEIDDDDLKREWGNAGLPIGGEKLEGERRHLFRHKELFFIAQGVNTEIVSCASIRGRCLVTLLNQVEDLACYDKPDMFFYSLTYNPVDLSLVCDKGAIRVGRKYQAVVPDFVVKEELNEEQNEEAPPPVTLQQNDQQNALKSENGDSSEASHDPDENKENDDSLMIDEGPSGSASPAPPALTAVTTPSVPFQTTERERAVFHPGHNLTDQEIDQFLIIARAVGTFSRALDTNTSARFPTLHMVAAAASRDITLFHAMALLHHANYDLGQAVRYLCPPCNKETYPFEAEKATALHTASLGGPILCRDQLEEWSTAESNLFEEALEKYGKDFHEMRADFLPWKSVKDLVEYYYMWKTTNRYQDNRKAKKEEREEKLKQVYIPPYNKPLPNQIGTASATPVRAGKPCESCKCEESYLWFRWGAPSAGLIICQDCHSLWKRMGCINRPHLQDTYDLKEPEREVAAKSALANADKQPPARAPPLSRPASSVPVVARLPTNHPAVQASKMTAEAGGSINAQIAAARAAQVALMRGTNPETVLNLSAPVAGLGTSSSKNAAAHAAAEARKKMNSTRGNFAFTANFVCRVARKNSPKEMYNGRRVARRPFKGIKIEQCRQHLLTTDPNVLFRTAQAIGGARYSLQKFVQCVQESVKCYQQSTSGQKRPASRQDGAGPAAKKTA